MHEVGIIVVQSGVGCDELMNGAQKAAVHRVRNAGEARTSVAFFINPSDERIVEPAKDYVQAENKPPLYKAFKYKEIFFQSMQPMMERDMLY